MKSVPSNFAILEPLLSSPAITSTLTLALIPLVGSQITLSQILAIQNNNHTQNTNIYVENPFSLKGKITRQTLNNFTIIKSITIVLVHVSRLKKKISHVFFALTHANYLSQRRQHFALSFLFSSSRTALSWLSSLSLSGSLLAALSFFLCGFLFLFFLYNMRHSFVAALTNPYAAH